MNRDFDTKQLAYCIEWWLNYQSCIGREFVLNEGSIKYPFVECISCLNISDITLEAAHPCFDTRRIDLKFNDVAKNIITFFEFKYIKDESTKDKAEKQRIFNDLIRLSFLPPSSERFFLICGNQHEFISAFQRIIRYQGVTRTRNAASLPATSDSEGFYKKWFSFDPKAPDITIDLSDQTKEYKDIYQDFVSGYSQNYATNMKPLTLSLPPSIKTTLVHLSENATNESRIYEPTKIGIWKISN